MTQHQLKVKHADRTRKTKYIENQDNYKFLLDENPKRNYFLETKNTEI